jgi:DNA helicase-2/ATP-dependent DNA helicase PcrA
MNSKKVNIIIGPPGTGKTTTLLNLVENCIESGFNPTEIGFLAFTKKAANEAKDRAIKKFGLSNDELMFFRTIHSLCYRQLGLSKSEVMQTSHYRELGERLGIEFTSKLDINEGTLLTSKKGDRLLFHENMRRIKQISLKEQWQSSYDEDINWFELSQVVTSFCKYKDLMGLSDYTDMLSKFISEGVDPKLKILFIDEAQDLSALQWQVIDKLSQHPEIIYVAGDDDQAIFRWAGADVERFRTIDGKLRVLGTSFRVPGRIHDFASKIIGRVSERRPKRWKPRLLPGDIQWYSHYEQPDVSQGSWLLLARNGYMLRQLEDMCERNGYLYVSKGTGLLDSPIISAIKAWEKLRKNKVCLHEEIKLINRYTSNKLLISRDKKSIYTKESAQMPNLVWHEGLDKIRSKDREYIIACLRQKESFKEKPRIKISTIHGAKGGEADNVMLLTDLAPRSFRDMNKHPDDEARVFYVGCTRAKESLHLIQPLTNLFYVL